MPRRQVRFLADHYYHVYNRGVNGNDIFFERENYAYLLRLLKRKLGRFAISIVAYCLMPNHYHFLLTPGQDGNTHLFMQSLWGSYSQAVNRQQVRYGPLFQGRFRAVVVDKDPYLVHVARYIHLNPVTAGLAVAPEEWPYSNYADLVGLRGGTLRDETLVPGYFESGEAYRRFVEQHLREAQEIEGLEEYLIEEQSTVQPSRKLRQ